MACLLPSQTPSEWIATHCASIRVAGYGGRGFSHKMRSRFVLSNDNSAFCVQLFLGTGSAFHPFESHVVQGGCNCTDASDSSCPHLCACEREGPCVFFKIGIVHGPGACSMNLQFRLDSGKRLAKQTNLDFDGLKNGWRPLGLRY